MTQSISLADIRAARERIQDGVALTPCPLSVPLSEVTGCEIYCKLEFLQRTGSFKERGARNALLLLSDEQRKKGVTAASAGNHALALAHHGNSLGIPVTVVMPTYAPLIKQTNCRKLGAKVIVQGNSFAEAAALARELVSNEGLTYVHGYDDPGVIAGAGTLGLEVLEQVPDADAVIVPLGGGGLAAGVSLAIKSLRPQVQVIGVQAANATAFSTAFSAEKPVEVTTQPTLADGLAVSKAGALAVSIAGPRLNQIVTVSEAELALAVVRLMELEKSVVEGAGAASLAAVLSGKLPELAGKKVVLLLCGGNIDLTILARLIDAALVADGRLARFTAEISDRPGGLATFTTLLKDIGVSVQDIVHDRTFCGTNIAAVNVLCTVETRDAAHLAQLYERLTAAGIRHFAHVGRE
ncbi:threonine ammonia-lyase [Anatilimnocola floriformis]|uniref:threonine ammonia-lyase n=1 Tax=Anatilimnocola floriformis TaxID=2948575 RepID=UPI0020C3BAAD|nr:threonine ammonia-lyase [Anatilimnocola floriformis]